MKHQPVVTTAVLIGLGLPSCSGDKLEEGWKPPGPGDEDVSTGIPIQPGDTFWYMFTRTFRPDQATCTGGQGLVCGEKQSSGHLCLEVASVQDTETPEYQDAPETVISATTRIVGSAGGGDIVFDDDLATGAPDPAVVDAALEPLWLRHLSVPTRGHGLLSPVERAYSTREAPVPGNQELAHLPFFDVRVSSKWDWGGWERTNDDCESLYTTEADCPDTCRWDAARGCTNKASNFLNGILSYFLTTFGSAYYTDDDVFYVRHPFNPVCGGHTSSSDCIAAQCTWDFPANECLALHTLDVRWRHELTTGHADLRGLVMHALRLEYSEDGSVRAATETIVPDPNPSAPESSDLVGFAECGQSRPCATATLSRYPDPWEDAYCTF